MINGKVVYMLYCFTYLDLVFLCYLFKDGPVLVVIVGALPRENIGEVNLHYLSVPCLTKTPIHTETRNTAPNVKNCLFTHFTKVSK